MTHGGADKAEKKRTVALPYSYERIDGDIFLVNIYLLSGKVQRRVQCEHASGLCPIVSEIREEERVRRIEAAARQHDACQSLYGGLKGDPPSA